MSQVRAKFRCHTVHDHTSEDKDGKVYGTLAIEASPVYSTDPEHENKAFWDASPSGKFEISVTNPTAWPLLPKPGQEFYIDLTPAE